jgi:hypothetical protein
MCFSRQDEFAGRAAQLWAVLESSGRYPRLGRLEMDDMRGRPPLQAADLVAYELLKFDPQRPDASRVPFRRLLDIDPNAFVVDIDADYLADQARPVRRMLDEELP